MSELTVKGGCHCGRIRFEVQIEEQIVVHHCNCSICRMLGFIHLIVPAAQFRLQQGKEDLAEYRFNTGVARHFFCTRCGIESFYVPRSNPDGFSVNVRCLDLPPSVKMTEEPFDGRNWEQHAHTLRHLSQPKA